MCLTRCPCIVVLPLSVSTIMMSVGNKDGQSPSPVWQISELVHFVVYLTRGPRSVVLPLSVSTIMSIGNKDEHAPGPLWQITEFVHFVVCFRRGPCRLPKQVRNREQCSAYSFSFHIISYEYEMKNCERRTVFQVKRYDTLVFEKRCINPSVF